MTRYLSLRKAHTCMNAHTHALLIPGLDNGGSHVTANVVNPSKRNLLRDLKKEN